MISLLRVVVVGLLCLVAWAGASEAAIGLGTPTTHTATDVAVDTFAHTCEGGSGRLLVVLVGGASGVNSLTTSVTYNAVALTELFDLAPVAEGGSLALYYLVAPFTGTANIVVTRAATQDSTNATALCLTGVDQSSPLGTPQTLYESSGAGAASVTVTAGATDLILDVIVDYEAGPSLTPGANQTALANLGEFGVSWQLGSTGGVMSWTAAAGHETLLGAVPIHATLSVITQTAYRFREDDGSETTATWAAAENTAVTRATVTATRLRVQADTTGADPGAQALTLQYKRTTDPSWVAVPVTSPRSGTLDLTVNLGSDDAQQIGTAMTLTGTTIGGSLDATTDWAGMRWSNVDIPAGATITAAYLSVVPSSTLEDEPLVTVFFENADNPGTFTTGASNISGRTRTTGVAWSSTDLAATGTSYHNSPSLVSDLQTVVSRGGWAAGNALVVLIQGGATTTRDLTIEAFENTGNNPPKLHVDYTVPTAFELRASANVTASGENTTRQLTIPAGKSSGNFGGGRLQDDENPGDAVDLALNGFREDEWSLQATAAAVPGAIYEFRLVDSSASVLDTYSVTPSWTIGTGAVARKRLTVY